MSDWKKAHANEAEKMADHKYIDEQLEVFAMNMGFALEGLPRYGLKKIVYTTAQVVLARARGFEPEKLAMTDEEFTAHQQRLLEVMLKNDVPTTIIAGDFVAHLDGDDRP